MQSIAGPMLCGFCDLFESYWGNLNTPVPYCTVTPTFVGNSMLPFRCPSCKEVPQELACPETRERYHDKREGRDNYWCPLCGYRFEINLKGVSLSSDLKAGAMVGPSTVTCDGQVTWQDKGWVSTVLGALFGSRKRGGYY